MNPGLMIQIAWSFLLPVGLVAISLFLSSKIGHRTVQELAVPLALAFGLATGHWVLSGPLIWPPRESPHGVIWMVIGSVFFVAALRPFKLPLLVHGLIRAAWVLILISIQFNGDLQREWSGRQLVMVILLMEIVSLFFWASLELLIRSGEAIVSVTLWIMIAGSVGGLVFLSGNADLSHPAMVLAICLSVLWFGASLGWETINLSLGITTVATALIGLLQESYLYSDVSLRSILMLSVVPVLGWIIQSWFQKWNFWFRLLAISAGALIPCGLSIIWALAHMSGGSY